MHFGSKLLVWIWYCRNTNNNVNVEKPASNPPASVHTIAVSIATFNTLNQIMYVHQLYIDSSQVKLIHSVGWELTCLPVSCTSVDSSRLSDYHFYFLQGVRFPHKVDWQLERMATRISSTQRQAQHESYTQDTWTGLLPSATTTTFDPIPRIVSNAIFSVTEHHENGHTKNEQAQSANIPTNNVSQGYHFYNRLWEWKLFSTSTRCEAWTIYLSWDSAKASIFQFPNLADALTASVRFNLINLTQ